MRIASGAGVALLIAFIGPVQAEGTSRFALTFEGGWAQADFTRAYSQQFGPAQFSGRYFTDDAGHYGKAALSYGFAPGWDVELSVSGQAYPTSLKGAFLGCCILSTWTSLEMTEIGLDIGLHRQFGTTDIRFGGGLTGSEIRADLRQNVVGSGVGLDSGDTYDTQHFRGIGPKLSVDATFRLPGAESERLIAGLEVATLWGDLAQDRSVPDGGGGQILSSGSENRQLISAGLYLGLSVPLANGTVRGGVRHDFVQAMGGDPIASGVDGFLQQGIGATTLFFGYSQTF